MPPYKNIYDEFIKRGDELLSDLPGEIQTAAERNWEPTLVQGIRNDFSPYVRVVSKLALWLAALAFVPLSIAIIFLAQHKPASGVYAIFYYLFLVLFVFFGLAAIRLIWPIIFLARLLKRMPAAYYKELVWSALLSLDVLNLLITGGLICYLLFNLDGSISLPVVVVLFLWGLAPWLAYMAERATVFIKIRLGQLITLLLVTLFVSVSPIPVKDFQWWASRQVANKLRPMEQKEITSAWDTLQWFTQEGQPNVWYSSTGRDYHLFAAPGFDTATGQPLQPVASKETKEMIYAAFVAQRDEQKRQEALAAKVQQDTVDAMRQAQAIKDETERVRRLADEAKLRAEQDAADKRAQIEAEARTKQLAEAAEKDAAASAKQVLTNSVNSSLLRARISLIAIVEANGLPAQETMDQIALRLTQIGRATESRVFTPFFYTTPLAEKLVSEGPAEVLPKLGIANITIIIGRLSTNSQAPDANGFITTDCRGMLTVFSSSGKVLGSLALQASGAARDKAASITDAVMKARDTIDYEKLASLLSQ